MTPDGPERRGKTLLVLRHGKSSWSDPDLADHDRPLKKRGRRGARSIGEQLRDAGLAPDLVLSSTARRARSTARRCRCAFVRSRWDGRIRSSSARVTSR